jgi:hypothetical protein
MQLDHWWWTGWRSPAGYGKLGSRWAHRLAHELLVGPIPEGWVVDHLCREPSCVNPEHLQAVTTTENWERRWT